MSLTKTLETFIRSFPSSFKRKYVHMVACTVVFVGPAHFVFKLIRAAMLLVLFPAVQTKTMVTRSLLPISTVACKGPFCVEVLSSFYCRFFVEEGQFINSTSSLHLCRHFFYLLTLPRFGALKSWKRVFRKSTSLLTWDQAQFERFSYILSNGYRWNWAWYKLLHVCARYGHILAVTLIGC